MNWWILCSTPGGIGTVIGLEAQAENAADLRCSTPGGIGTVIGLRLGPIALHVDVLNARRHRHGDRSGTKTSA